MNPPTPAIVSQEAVRRLPRAALLLLGLAYVVPGFVGRDPWKSADMTTLGYIWELALGRSDWLAPRMMGLAPEFDALLPYWLGAWAVQLAGSLPGGMAPELAVRVPFMLLLALALMAAWYGVYYLARTPGAQPVAFAFGGEARPTDYARAMADGGLLALIACLGLAQFSHEVAPSVAQLGFTALAFYAIAALPYRRHVPVAALFVAMVGLALSGAPSMAVLFALGGAAVTWWDPPADATAAGRHRATALVLSGAVLAALVATLLDSWRWRLGMSMGPEHDWRGTARLLLWFTWPAWPLALWTLWRWRLRLRSRHLALPLWFALVPIAATLTTPTPDRSLLLGLPALATLAAFALPTLQRSVSALIDWFTLLFFSTSALVIWVVWISLQTGVPPKPAANVARLAPGFEPAFSLVAFAVAVAGTLAWGWLVRWRAGRHRAALWKSLVLPAGGTALCWLLLMTLWLPALDYARSYVPVVRKLKAAMAPAPCVQTFGLDRGQLAALRFHGQMELRPLTYLDTCPYLIVAGGPRNEGPVTAPLAGWTLVATIPRPTDRKDVMLLYRAAP